MFVKKVVESLKLGYQRHYKMPKEFIPRLYNDNLFNLIIVLHIIFNLAISALTAFLIYYKGHIYQNPKLFYYVVYYLGFSFIGLCWAKVVKRHPPKNIKMVLVPTLYTAVCCIIGFVINFFMLGNHHASVILFAILGILLVVFFNINPMYFVVGAPILTGITVPYIYKDFGIISSVEQCILCIVIILLSFYERRLNKRELIENKLLKHNNEELLQEVEHQEQEILEKDVELENRQSMIIEIQNNTIIGLSSLVENRDSDTGEHIRRTAAYVGVIARHLQSRHLFSDIITDRYIDLLIKAAPMHDIGKIVVPDYILKKNGKLTAEEFEQIKRHTTEGGRIISEILGNTEDEDYVQIAQEIAAGHHEKWDGTGYPYNKKGEEIPLSARIMTIADVFDALVSPRCYKDPITMEHAYEIILAGSGTHFDPVIVPEFLNIYESIQSIFEIYQD